MFRKLFGKSNDDPPVEDKVWHLRDDVELSREISPSIYVEQSFSEGASTSAGQNDQRSDFQPLNDSIWEDYYDWWSVDKEDFPDFATWAQVRKVVHAHFNLDTKIWQTYAQRDLIGPEQTIPSCREQMALAPMAKVALEADHKLEFEWNKREYEKSKREWDRYYNADYPGWKPVERPFELPEHKGFKQLAIIYDKMHDYLAAIDVCREALAVDWPGDWQVRIARYQKRLDRDQARKAKSHASNSVPSPLKAFCTQCGEQLTPADRFCGSCGAKRSGRA